MDSGNRNFAEVYKKKGSPSPKPIEIPRPSQRKPAKRGMSSPDEVRAFMARR